jgi:predicted phage tail component-like protein
MITLTINGINLESALGSGVLSINEVKGRGPSRRDADLLEVPGRNGAFLRRVKTPPRELSVRLTLRGSSITDLRGKVDQLNELVTTEVSVPIEFSDEDKTYYGVLSDTTDWDEIRSFGQGTLQFVCPDPYKYADEQSAVFNVNTGQVSVTNNGNEPTLPRFEATALANVTHIDFVRHDGRYMRIGQPATLDDTIFEKETLVMHDTMDSVTGWTTATYVDNGAITGSMTSSGGAFVVDLYGPATDPPVWQGPSLKRSIGESLDQFQIDVLLEAINTPDKIGMIEIYLLDADNNTVAKIGTEDVSRTADLIQNKMQLGPTTNRYNHHVQAENPWGWRNFNGIIRLLRDVTEEGVYRFSPYFAIIEPDGTHNWVSSAFKYYDFNNAYTTPITQIQVAIRVKAPGSYADMKIFDIKAYRINEDPTGIPTILKTGDSLVIDHTNEDILINGEPRKDLKDFGASYFGLEPGTNTILQYPVGALDTTVYWRNKYK